MPNLELYTENGEDKIRSLGGDSHCLRFNNDPIRPFLKDTSLLQSYFNENSNSISITKLDLSNKNLGEINISEIQWLFRILPKTIDHIDLKLNYSKSKQKEVLAIVPAWIKTVSFDDDPIDLDSYWLNYPEKSIAIIDYYGEKDQPVLPAEVVASRLVYQLAQEAAKPKPNFLDLPLVKLLKQKFGTEHEQQQIYTLKFPDSKVVQLTNNFMDCLLLALMNRWSLFASALLGYLKLSVCKAEENTRKKYDDAVNTVVLYIQSANDFNSADNKQISMVNHCHQQINVISEANPCNLALAFHLEKNLPSYQMESGTVLSELQERTCKIIDRYIKLNREQKFSLFSRHGLIGRMRAERLNKALSESPSIKEFTNSLITFLADPANGNYYKDSLRIMLVKNLLNSLYVPRPMGSFQTNEKDFNNHLKMLANCLSLRDKKVQVPENKSSSCCSFGG